MSPPKHDVKSLLRLADNVGASRSRAVLVTGGAGYIGSHVAKLLEANGYEPVTYDNLSTGHRSAVRWGPLVEGDIADEKLLRETLRRFRIGTIMHFAASALVGESMEVPELYFRNNAANSANLLEATLSAGISQFVFSSTCAIYGAPEETPITERHPQHPMNPYGESKLFIERMIDWYSRLRGLRSVSLRYFNVAGADPGGELGEDHDPETHLIPNVLRAAAGEIECVQLYGSDHPTPDGTAVRDYVHVWDLAEAHLRALQYLETGGKSLAINLGTGTGVSVSDVVRCVEEVTGRTVPCKKEQRRPGDPPVLVADYGQARDVLGWTPRRSNLPTIVADAWKWRTNRANRVPATTGRSPASPSGNRRVAVVGAGPAGITAAYELSKHGVAVDVYEASQHVGGLAKTIELWGQRVDLGPHRFFSNDARVNRLWLEVMGQNYQMVDRLTRIFYDNRLFYYPLKPVNALSNLGGLEAMRCALSYGRQVATPLEPDGSFEDWVVNAFGRRLFEIFFKTYSEKLWGISCKELDADFAAQRIKKLSLFEAVKNAFLNGQNNGHKTLVDRFAYPENGTGEVYERMASRIAASGNRVLLGRPVQRVVAIGNSVVGLELSDGAFESYDHVISTMPLSLLVERLPETSTSIRNHLSHLTYRNTILVYLRVEADNLFPDNWLYVHSTELSVGRVTNFRNWTPAICGSESATILALEYWANDNDPVWSWEDKEIVAMASREIRSSGLTGAATISDGCVHRLRRSYPVYRRGYKDHLRPVEDYLSGIRGLSVIGRYGAFKYNNQDHSILMGSLAAKSILDSSEVDLWRVNTDYEDYQESAIITEEGLVTA